MILAIANHKGGTGKTTTAVNLAASLLMRGHSVLLVDIDPQANLSFSLGIKDAKTTVANLMLGTDLEKVIKKSGMYDIVPSGLNLYHLEDELMNLTRKYFLLKKALQNSNYEFVIIDCPPSFSFYTLNVLCATDSVLITMNLDVLSLQGLNQMLSLIDEIKGEANKNLEINGVLCVNVDERKQLTHEVVDIVKNIKVPLYETYIRTNVKAAEAPSFGVSVIEYAPDSNSAKDYNTFCDEFLESLSLTVNNN